MLSISDFKNINKPMVWTLHDMWASVEQSMFRLTNVGALATTQPIGLSMNLGSISPLTETKEKVLGSL